MKQYLFVEMDRHDGERSLVSRHEFKKKMTIPLFKEFLEKKYDLMDEDDEDMDDFWDNWPIESSKDGKVFSQDCEETNYMMIAL